ncbi:uncharacterized protein TA07125 [Theileria annulata]|uniref:S5 DRBM domain-containing protein n=1 Tax=Theileria annulata TaxID=5874 RepID=Q4UAL7_THEAN|nr:uncharacterized protein TA07125 [Theileria annulata]CAI76134.1 hypothetical protein, conserved [Theileria annulata]|eukprot:XP_952760.1 hypothetical protein, conserved [Theileria annulata]
MCNWNNLLLIRKIHSGYIKRVLESKKGPFHKKYQKIFADQRERINYNLKDLRYEKDTLTRELLIAKNELFGVFNLQEAKLIKDSTTSNDGKLENRCVNEARRIYRILRPDSPSFFENDLLDENPVFTSSCYTLAVYSLLESLIEDVYSFCEYLEIPDLPEKTTKSLTKIFEKLENFFKLNIDGSNSDLWIDNVWSKLHNLLIDDFKSFTSHDMKIWLKNHLNRVSINLKTLGHYDELYNFSEHILYDSIPIPEQILIENKIGFPIEKSQQYLSTLLSLQKFKVYNIEELIKSLESLGLSKWFKMLPNEIETNLFGTTEPIELLENLKWTQQDIELSYLLIETMSRNLEHLLDIETYTPNSILSNITLNLKNNLFVKDENKWLSSENIKEMILKVYNKFDKKDLKEYIDTPLKQMLIDEENYTNKVGAIVLEPGKDKDWKWIMPSVDCIFDKNRNMYIRNKSNLDPLIRLENLKSFILSKKRMRSMTKEGRVYFIRVITAIGDGNGYFGIGIGYGNDVNSAKNAGIENGLKNMYFLDYDPFESLTTPVLGTEYGSRCLIKSRPIGKGVRCNRKFLPLLYLIGLDNVRFKLKGTSSWITRIRSIRKALESIMSRKTICNMLGRRYFEVGSPGDHTIHWPDEWFNPLLKEYLNRINKLKAMRFKFSKRNRIKFNLLLPTDIKNIIPNYNKSILKSQIININKP